jgi:hypothetical protein
LGCVAGCLISHPGLKTRIALRQKTNELAQADADHRAVYRLLSSILDPIIASFDEEPLSAGVTKTAFEWLLAVVRDADNAISLAPDRQIDALNNILPSSWSEPAVGRAGFPLIPRTSVELTLP